MARFPRVSRCFGAVGVPLGEEIFLGLGGHNSQVQCTSQAMKIRLTQILNRLSLQTVLTVPFVLQIVGVVGVVGYLSFRNGQIAVSNLATQLRQELTARILQELNVKLKQPYVINQINAYSVLQGDIDVTTGKGEHQLWQQTKVFPFTNLIYCAIEKNGAFLGVGRSAGGIGDTIQISVANRSTSRFIRYYAIDATGRRSFLRSIGNKRYDPRLRPWYKAAKLAGQPVWSEVYLDFDALLPTITANTPIYDNNNGNLLGVCATDLILSEELNDFLRSLRISKSGIAFIMESSGQLIASSTKEPITLGRGENTRRLAARESENQLIRGVSQYLSHYYYDLEKVESASLDFLLDGDRQFLEVVRLRDQHGLDWIVVLAIPEHDFMDQIHRNTMSTVVLCLVALSVTVLIGFLITHWLTQPLRRLSKTAKAIAVGDWDKMVELDRSDVIGELSRSFSSMAHQLQESFNTLEERIERRTFELKQMNQILERLANVDVLTQVANRRYFDQYFADQWHSLAQEQQPLSLLLCDVDYFKRYNDTYGHQQGDYCLQQIAQLLTQSIHRPTDLVARYGGEEFVILMPNTDTNGAEHIAQHIQSTLHATKIPHQDSDWQQVTMSIGVATMFPHSQESHQLLFATADRALYQAKSRGRNGYCVGSHP